MSFLGYKLFRPHLAPPANIIFVFGSETHNIFEHQDDEYSREEHNCSVLLDNIPHVKNERHVCKYSDDTYNSNDSYPHPNWFDFDGQSSLTEIDNLVFLSIQGDHSDEEHHDVQKWHDGGKQHQRSKGDNNLRVSFPGAVYLISVHVCRHPVLLLIEAVDGFKVV